jgi:hypothetical protein
MSSTIATSAIKRAVDNDIFLHCSQSAMSPISFPISIASPNYSIYYINVRNA